jgi:hypothetical protein
LTEIKKFSILNSSRRNPKPKGESKMNIYSYDQDDAGMIVVVANNILEAYCLMKEEKDFFIGDGFSIDKIVETECIVGAKIISYGG